MNFLEFIQRKHEREHTHSVLTESFKSSDVTEANKLILSYFKKNISGGTVAMDPVPLTTTVDGVACQSILFYLITDSGIIRRLWSFNYTSSGAGSSSVYSVDFFDHDGLMDLLFGDGIATTRLSLYTLGQSIAYFLPVIVHVLNNDDWNIDANGAMGCLKRTFKKGGVSESHTVRPFNLGAVTYTIHEGLSDDVVSELYGIHEKREYTEAETAKKEKYDQFKASLAHKYDSEENRRASIQLEKEYRAINRAIQGGAVTFEDLEIALKKDVKVKVTYEPETKKAIKTLETNHKDPTTAFKEMNVYVGSVIKGQQPGVILCGAPGVGKTYRVLQHLKAKGYVNGQNMSIIKGKCTPRQLYLDLYNFQHVGEIVVIDDADALIGPKAPEDVINILKAALDSTSDDEGRLVSYRVSGKLEDDEGVPVPKSFYYRGSIIVITNYSVGQLDTAVRGRVFTQTLDFTTEEILNLIHDLMPEIEKTKISMACKNKAYDYLMKMAREGTNMEVSVRSFTMCAKIFQMCEGEEDLTDTTAENMIAEQVRNQALRTGKHF